MPLEIRPEPTPEEAAAIETALREFAEQGRNGRGPWWEAGVAENLDVSEGSPPVVDSER
jgi:hypothetical protein